jgi:hypothetical protein
LHAVITNQANTDMFIKIVAAFLMNHGAGIAIKDNDFDALMFVVWAMREGLIEWSLTKDSKLGAVAIGRRFDGKLEEFNWQPGRVGKSLCVDCFVSVDPQCRKELIRKLLLRYPDIQEVFGFRSDRLKVYNIKNLRRLYGRN